MRSATVRLPGHPDLACDLVAEAIVDEYLRRDPTSRIRLNVTGGRGVLFVAGDVLSQADFDVSALVKRTLGSIGITDDVEPFISLEPVSSERVATSRISAETPVTVIGYATVETESLFPRPVDMARRIASRLQDKRDHDPEWFWLGADVEVTVHADTTKPSHVYVNVEHRNEPLESMREKITKEIAPLIDGASVIVNAAGACDRRGLSQMTGMSGRPQFPYGTTMLSTPSGIGRDPLSAEKAGAWLARAMARRVLRSGEARAIVVQATYVPGEDEPRAWVVRDETGKDMSGSCSRAELALSRVMDGWWRPGLNTDAAKAEFAGGAGLPWEE